MVTFGRRLRTAGVSLEDRQDLLGHKSDRITTHYSAAEVENLILAANKACAVRNDPMVSVLELLNQARLTSTKLPQGQNKIGSF